MGTQLRRTAWGWTISLLGVRFPTQNPAPPDPIPNLVAGGGILQSER